MGSLEVAVALALVDRECRIHTTPPTKAALAGLLHFWLGDPERVFLRQLDFLVTAGYIGSFDGFHYQLTKAGETYLEEYRLKMASILQMMTRTW